MPEYNTITVMFFRTKAGKYHFYLTKKGPDLPILPTSWSPIGGMVTPKDEELCSSLIEKYGDMAPDMLNRLTALRIVFERNLFNTEKIIDIDVHENVHDLIIKIDPEILNVWFHSMVPCGYQKLQTGENNFHTNYFLFISPSDPTLRNMKLKRISDGHVYTNLVLEEKAKWFKAAEIKKQYYNLNKLFSPSIATIVEKITNEFKKPFDAAREMEQKRGISKRISFQIFPFTWRFSVPAPTLPPYNTTNIYVIGNEKRYIIDPGSAEFDALSDLILYIEKNIDKLEGILLTNHYPDHCNYAQYLKDTFDLPICASKETARILQKEGFNFNSILKEGTEIPIGSYPELDIDNWKLRVLEFPGSSKGSIGFWDSRGLLFSGISLHRDLTTSTASYDKSYADLLESFGKIKKLNPKFVLADHGRIIIDTKQTLSENLLQLKHIEKKLIENLKRGVTELELLVDIITPEDKLEWKTYFRQIIESGLNKLAYERKITKIGIDYMWNKRKN